MDEFLITPDLSEAVEIEGSITPGIYSARVNGFEVKEAKNGGKYLKWTLVIFGAEGDLAKFNNWKIFYNTMTSGKGAGMLKGFYKACMGTDLEGTFAPAKLVGCEVAVTVAQGKNQDGSPSKYSEVKSVKTLIPF